MVALPLDWHSMVDLSQVKYGALNKAIIEMLSNAKYVYSGLLKIIKASHHKIDLNDRTRPIRQ